MRPDQSTFPPTRPKLGRVKLGCMGQLVLLLVVLVVVGLGLPALITPWGFYMGGSFHLIPVWHGWGRMHSNTAGGDYVIQVSFNPKVGRHLGPRHVDGNAWLCTPRGEKFRLHLGGDFQKDLKLDTNGKTASFYMNSYNLKNQFTGNTRPSLELRGKWMNADLVLDDQGSIARNFEPDGTLYNGHSPSRPYMKEVVPVTLHEGSNSEFEAACKAVKGKRQVKE
jgi:hypothetical protein